MKKINDYVFSTKTRMLNLALFHKKLIEKPFQAVSIQPSIYNFEHLEYNCSCREGLEMDNYSKRLKTKIVD